MRQRTKARQAVVEALYEAEFSGDGGVADAVIEDALLRAAAGPEAEGFAKRLIEAIRSHRADIDALIKKHSENWSLERMTAVDKSILRLAACELLYFEETPYKVVIDEAVELAKKFGGEESSSFVNGILDRMAGGKAKNKAKRSPAR